MKATMGAIAFNVGGITAGAVVIGGVIDVVVSSHMLTQGISGNTPISGLTIGGLIIAGGFAMSAIYKGGAYLLELGGQLEKWKTLINDAVGVARTVNRLNEVLDDTSRKAVENSDIIKEHDVAIKSLEEWRATMDPTLFRQRRNPPTDMVG